MLHGTYGRSLRERVRREEAERNALPKGDPEKRYIVVQYGDAWRVHDCAIGTYVDGSAIYPSHVHADARARELNGETRYADTGFIEREGINGVYIASDGKVYDIIDGEYVQRSDGGPVAEVTELDDGRVEIAFRNLTLAPGDTLEINGAGLTLFERVATAVREAQPFNPEVTKFSAGDAEQGQDSDEPSPAPERLEISFSAHELSNVIWALRSTSERSDLAIRASTPLINIAQRLERDYALFLRNR